MARWHALWLKPDLAPEIEREVNIERLLIMARHQPVAAPAHAFNSIILAVASWPYVTQKWLLVALVVIFQIAAAWQLRSWWRHRNAGRPSRVTDRTINRTAIWSLAFGGVWGLLAALLLATKPGPEAELLICMVIAGIAAGGAMMTYTVPATMLGFLFLCMVPPWTVIALSPGRVSTALLLYTVVYAGFLIITGCYSYRGFVEGVRLRLVNADLAYKAEAANRAKSRFLANMSHELRTPLNAIVGFAEMIHNQFKGPVGNPQYIEYAGAIHESGLRLTSIINDILDHSKIEAGQAELEEEAIAVTALVERATKLMQPAISAGQIALEVALEPNLPDVLVDVRKLDQALLNLISNAVKFTPPGGRIRIEGRRAADGGITLRIADTGIGIAADKLKDVLMPFVQGREAGHTPAHGTGLGLPLGNV